MTRRVTEHRVNDGVGHVARDDDLLEQAAEDEPGRAGHVHVSLIAPNVQLRDQFVRPNDGTGHQVREEREIEERIDGRGNGSIAASDVNHVADRHEREERDAHGQDHIGQRDPEMQPQSLERIREADGEEAVVLEVSERGQHEHHRDDGGGPPVARLFLARHQHGTGLGYGAHAGE